ncbi:MULTISPECIES: DUF2187 domain-containing protein [Aerococcus]|uniref:DUF2187 domain-containing protein n=1 Tax=Aerococcus urinae (strain CCUG 59500 / ACS-120-V-Col10a) TaxID=2976812 RepID=UPI000200E4FA|nr:DUF2187 domain-containing protein [Aerococcus sp. Group 1]AEA01695.1 hypothetical protein HMPREF9243_0976 [Aerococcus sp. Group 1]MCY3031582.1 DUF2187 domain-containing protein [Aerococcus sp. Group 1]MCY3055199.1 DUF2187 domain-containing protein [Aerococcus sp. Group 1]MCY3056929.1 DUF2187 domain-containing protein [Aerococcus sp. Group 1]MCY3062425.1 DUF2187 domain-containing protein [Aerococcus sp. Group 1]
MGRKPKITAEMQSLVETELRRGTSNSRIANLLDMPYEQANEIIDTIKESIRPNIGDVVKFQFRTYTIIGEIEKLLTNSAILKIDWSLSSRPARDILEERTVVNFKDIEEYVSIASSDDDK